MGFLEKNTLQKCKKPAIKPAFCLNEVRISNFESDLQPIQGIFEWLHLDI